MVNILRFADDIVLLAASARGLLFLIDSSIKNTHAISMTFNMWLTICMVFSP
jgi:hypothetical protein